MMELEALTNRTVKLVEERGAPLVLDVEHSIHLHKPALTGSDSPASYYIRPPEEMSADEFIEWFQEIPGFRDFKLTLVSILGIDTFHQPLISTDDYARKYFHDNHERFVRVVGKSDNAIEAMATFVEALKRPFDAKEFPHHDEFSVSAYRPPEEGRATDVKLLFKPANHNQLMRVERQVTVHLYECNLGQEIRVARHATRDQAPELMLSTNGVDTAGVRFLQALVDSLPRASAEEIAKATETAELGSEHHAPVVEHHAHFVPVQAPVRSLEPHELRKQVIASLMELMKVSHYGEKAEIQLVQGGSKIEVRFPRSPASLWMGTTFNKAKHLKELTNFCISLRADPIFRDGWSAIYEYDGKAGVLAVRIQDPAIHLPDGWKTVQ